MNGHNGQIRFCDESTGRILIPNSGHHLFGLGLSGHVRLAANLHAAPRLFFEVWLEYRLAPKIVLAAEHLSKHCCSLRYLY
jgi:hypothetical protein